MHLKYKLIIIGLLFVKKNININKIQIKEVMMQFKGLVYKYDAYVYWFAIEMLKRILLAYKLFIFVHIFELVTNVMMMMI